MRNENAPSGAPAPAVRLHFVLLLTALTALGQFGSNVFLPGLPALTQELRSTGSIAAQAYTVYLLVFGAGQLLMGPLSDRWGRRSVGVVSTLLFIAGAAVCAVAPSMGTLLLGRALQGLGAAGAIVVGRASARDHFHGTELMRVMATMTIAFAAVPGFAPLLGGVLTQWLGWRSTLWAAALAGVALAGWVLVKLPPGARQPLSLARTVAVYAQTLRDPGFLVPALIGAGAIGAMSAFFWCIAALVHRHVGREPGGVRPVSADCSCRLCRGRGSRQTAGGGLGYAGHAGARRGVPVGRARCADRARAAGPAASVDPELGHGALRHWSRFGAARGDISGYVVHVF
jgi:MFS transporter, DHA1 family, multidrug resistance protein